MTFKEHNNRKKANQFAEFITGEPLRRLVANKVAEYAGENVSVFDGAAGSGQLEQFIQPSRFVAVEIQAEACSALQNNYPQAHIFNQSFFTYQHAEQCADETELCDVVVMNPPFSMKFKDLAEDERQRIQADFNWKKSGVVDDIFVLKGLAQSQRWGFFILPAGLGYRQTEKQFRTLIGNQLTEIIRVQNGFEDTQIDVYLLVIDKHKTNDIAKRALFDCKTQQVICADEWKIDVELWENIQPPPPPKEEIDEFQLEQKCRQQLKQSTLANLRISKSFVMLGYFSTPEFNAYCDELCVAIQNEKIY